jgi:hypothetical protein
MFVNALWSFRPVLGRGGDFALADSSRFDAFAPDRAPFFGRPGVVPLTASFRADFDATAKVLLIRVAGRFSDDSMAALNAVWRKLSAATGAKMGIADLSLICEFDPSVQGIRNLANQLGMTELHIMVAPQTYAYGVLRMFQGLSERSRPLLQIVHTIEEAFSALGIRSPQFAPWLTPALFQIQAAIS